MAGSDVFSTHVLSSEIAAADPNGVCTAQTTGGAANLTIDGALTDGGVATLVPARNATITSAGSSETGKTFSWGKLFLWFFPFGLVSFVWRCFILRFFRRRNFC